MLTDLVRLAAGPPLDPEATPREARIAPDGRNLAITLQSGELLELSAAHLRRSCRCAWCSRARFEGRPPKAEHEVAIASLAQVGTYAFHIAFTDGHARGIYPFAYLRSLGSAEAGTGTPLRETAA
jgi:DUF971 family protein